MTGGGKIVGLGPRRDEASLSSTALSVRKTRHWGSIHSVPLPPCSVQGCCLSGSPSQPRTRCSVLIAAPLPAPSAVLPTPALHVPSRRYYRQQSGSPRGSPPAPAEPLPEDRCQGGQATTGSGGCRPFPSR